MCSWTGNGFLISSVMLVAVVVGCGGDGGSGPPPAELVIQRAPTSSGDGQTAAPGEPLASPLRILITRSSEPEAGVGVDWATDDGGTVDPATSTTGADGIATATWTLGPAAGAQNATATADADGSPVTFTATAEDDGPPPPPADATIQVIGPTGGNRFDPTTVTIQAGETVAWVWPANAQNHNVLPDGTQPASSGAVSDGPKEYRFTFTTAGTYAYYCTSHGGPGGVGMSGTVVVQP